MSEANVTFRATVNGLVIILREEDSFDDIYNQMEKKVMSAGKFFKGASLDVKYRGRKLDDSEKDKIKEIMVTRTGAQIKSFEEDTDIPSPIQKGSGAEQNRIKLRKYFFKGINEGIAKFYRGTVRSGQLISFDGNLVIIGDVNPGGEIIATGNVIVMGSLRGIVHAGADGNKEAVVVAFNLQPMQLRIADVITRPPDEKESRNALSPELAFVKDDMVYIETFLPQR
ncbi:septum site-determining protein MinC [Anaerobacterium chartisolvens]|uniref:Probable septum site-determining protein MinC n=1 Tax=Anaerobacterium chartisolvens TaxID=1297424 RepID=A0A369BJN5_9FIRM|nr:septum site-determining protein MinC [Anaerobacterium chartisolvens]RCX20808.1 septum site-determining protein MinC [Anaerobacterium chartisolvens]